MVAAGFATIVIGPLASQMVCDSMADGVPGFETRTRESPYKPEDVAKLLTDFRDGFAKRYDVKPHQVQSALDAVRITFTSAPILYGNQELSGLTVDARDIRVHARRENVRETALAHELLHVMRTVIDGDGDALHKHVSFHDGFEALLWGEK